MAALVRLEETMRAILEDVVPFQDFRIQRTDTYSSDEWEERRDIQEIGRQLKERKVFY